MVELEVPKLPQVLSPCNSRRRSNDSNSPEFEFWMVRNPSFPQQDLHSADELFSGGLLLPLHQLHHHQSTSSQDPPPPPPTPQEEEPQQHESNGNISTRPGSESGPDFSAAISNLSASGFTSSKRWKDIFKKTDKKCSNNSNDDANDINKEKGKEKGRKKEKRNPTAGGGGGVTSAELNINLWPFRRTRSAGNGGTRPRNSSAATRKVSSAPCSRSNSAGESKSRKWPSSPARNGVHLGRSSPIWQVRRPTTTFSTASGGSGGGGRSSGTVLKSAEKGTQKDGNVSCRNFPASSGGGQKGKILSLNVPMCIGYRSQLSCRSEGVNATAVGGGSGGAEDGETMVGVRGGNLFNIRSLFSKKVY